MWDARRVRRVHAIVTGRVQGVSYRASTVAEARRLGLRGWVRNLPDGRVELEAEGPAQHIDALIAWCRRGPPAARVADVAIDELAPTAAETGFAVAY
jgi:acylphosphatase